MNTDLKPIFFFPMYSGALSVSELIATEQIAFKFPYGTHLCCSRCTIEKKYMGTHS